MAKGETISRTIAKQLARDPAERLDRFMQHKPPLRAAVFEALSPYVQQDILDKLAFDDCIDLLDALDLNRAQAVLAQMNDELRRDRLLSRLKSDLKDKAEYFLRFHANASLQLINFNYLLLPEESTVDDAATAVDAYYEETKKFPELLVHRDGLLTGEVQYAKLIRASSKSKINRLVSPIPTITYQSEATETIDLITHGESGKLVVKDTDDSVIGIIYTDEARHLFKNQPAASLYEFAGVAESERPFDSIRTKVHHRYKWLIINLATAFLAGAVVSAFEDTLSAIIILTMYLPIIAGMGGNASAQTLAVMVRGITMGDIRLKNCIPALKHEVGAGVVNGLITGCIVALVAILWNQDPLLGFVLFLSMVSSLIIAAVAGTIIPLFMRHIGKDPASSATIFITTVTDVFGFFSFLALAQLILL